VAVNDRVRPQRLFAAVGLIGVLTLAGCASPVVQEPVAPTPEDDDQASVASMLDPCAKPNLTTVEPGALTFVTSAVPAPPFFLSDQPADRLGLEADLAYELARTLGFRPGEVTWEYAPAEQIMIGDFTDYDVAIGGFAPTEDDRDALDYSQPYLEVDLVVVSENPQAIGVIIDGSGEVIDEATGDVDVIRWAYTTQGPARSFLIDRGLSLESVTNIVGADQVVEGAEIRRQSDAVVIDGVTAQWLTETTGNRLPVVPGVGSPTGMFSLGLVPGNPLIECVDRALNEMSELGTLDDLRERWLNPSQWRQD